LLQDSISLLRSQYLGLNRILSTLSELVNQTVQSQSERSILEDAARLLLHNHNFQYVTIFTIQQNTPKLVSAKSMQSLLRSDIDESSASWVSTCRQLVKKQIPHPDVGLVQREIDESFYYSLSMRFDEEQLGFIVVSSPQLDDNHDKFLPMFASVLTSLVMNKKQQAILKADVERRSVELESAWALAAKSDAAKTEFLSQVSHEYLTPLNQINNASALLLDSQLTPDQAQAVATIVNSVEDLNAKVGGTLDYVHGDAEVSGELACVRMKDCIESLTRPYERIAADKDLQFFVTSDEMPDVEVNQPRLQQVMKHLLSNAFKFTHQGSVEVRLRLLNVEGRLATIELRVNDTGIGIAPEDQTHIFNAFHQVSSSNSRAYQGTGLGLALCQRLVRSMGSEITVTSVPDQGSTFHFKLALTVADTAAPGISLADTTRADLDSGLCVLLVEDNLVNQKLAAKLLEKMGCEVDIANDGVDALDKFEESKYDLVFMDCQMPNMDGFEATTRIRELESATRTPIIALTANSLPEDRARSFSVGMDEFLTKPVAKEQLQQALHKWSATSSDTA
jgi:signal transduction histidine kinase/ActR/RegA family two-component response regulator